MPLSPKQQRRIEAKERKILRRAVRAVWAQTDVDFRRYMIFTFPPVPQAMRRDPDGVKLWTWKALSPEGRTHTLTIRTRRGRAEEIIWWYGYFSAHNVHYLKLAP